MIFSAPNLTVFVAARPPVLAPILELIDSSSRLRLTGTAGNGQEAIAYLERESADIALIDFALPGISGVKVAEFLVTQRPGIISVLLSELGNPEHYRRAMLAGAREFITWPVSLSELEFCLERVVQITRERARRHNSGSDFNETRSKALDSRWIVLCGGKGGVGTSFLAANLARMLSAHPLGFRTALIDFNITSADLAAILNVEPARYLTDLLPVAAELDRELLKSAAHRIDDHLDFFAGPPEIDTNEIFSADQVPLLVECWRELYDVLIVDLGTFRGESAAPVLSAADLILPTIVPEVLSIRASARFVRLLERMGINQNVIRPIVNRWTQGDIALDRISGHVGAHVLATIGPSPEVRRLLDDGRPLSAADDAEIRDSVESLAKSVLVSVGLMEGLHV